MKISIIGAGGVGGYFGGKLANAGYDVTFLARGEHLKAMQSNGLLVKSIHGDFKINPVKTTDKISDLTKSDLIIFGVKAWQLKDMGRELADTIDKNTILLPLQNGVLAIDELKEHIHPNNIIGGLCRIISKIEAPGIINHFGVDPAIVFGEIDNAKTERIARIKNIFDQSGFKSKIADDIQSEIWKKFISICLSGLLAITRSTYGELREIKETRLLMTNLLHEIFLLSKKIGIHIEKDFVEKTISAIDTFPYNSTASLARDVWEGKPSEIEYQNGTVVKLGEKYGVDTPINQFIYNCILPMEIRARKKSA
jgi:2-dehydropantoate 2-reductase